MRKVFVTKEQWALLCKDARFHYHAPERQVREAVKEVLQIHLNPGPFIFQIQHPK